MARAELTVCDICGKITDEIVGKIYFAAVTPARSRNGSHNYYDLHGDVGVCCVERLQKAFKWRKRMSKGQYNASRRRNALKSKVKKNA